MTAQKIQTLRAQVWPIQTRERRAVQWETVVENWTPARIREVFGDDPHGLVMQLLARVEAHSPYETPQDFKAECDACPDCGPLVMCPRHSRQSETPQALAANQRRKDDRTMSERDDALRQLAEEMAEMSDRLAADAQTALAQRILRWAHRISALLDAQANPQAQTWQPIETAPKERKDEDD
jgi:hypothetical protein